MPRIHLEPAQVRLKRSRNISHDIRPDHIRNALSDARAIIAEHAEPEFINRETAWLGAHMPGLSAAIDSMQTENYMAARTGGYLGAAVLRKMAQEGLIDDAVCQTNLLTWQLWKRSIAPTAIWDTEELDNIYGHSNAAALDEIKDKVAKTACAIVIALPLVPYG